MPKSFKPQMARILYILKGLNNGDMMNVNTIMEGLKNIADDAGKTLALSRRTILRDLEFMKDFWGLKIVYDAQMKSYVLLNKKTFLPTAMIDDQLVYALNMAAMAIGQHKGTRFHKELKGKIDEILGLFPVDDRSFTGKGWNHFSFLFPPPTVIDSDIWDTVVTAIETKHTLAILYQRATAKKPYTTRLDPYQIVNHNGSWYIVGRCHWAKNIRTFSLAENRLKSAEITGDRFSIPDDFDWTERMRNRFGIITGDREYEVVLRFHEGHSSHVIEREWHPTMKSRFLKDGRLEMTMTVSDLKELTRWILSWGAGVEVVKPKILRRIIRENAEEIVRVNAGKST